MMPPPLHQLLATAQQHHQAGRLREAENTYRQVLQQQPDHARALFMLGALAHQSGDIPAARDWLAKALPADPSFSETHFLLGLIHQQQRQLDSAISSYRKAISLQPNHVKAINNLGRALLDAGQLAEGLNLLKQVLALAPEHPGAHSNLGDAMRMMRDFDGAIVEYQRALAINPNFTEAMANQGAALAEKGQTAQGVACLRKAISINPQFASAHYNLAKALQEQNQFDEAIQHCRLFLELRPDYADAHNLLGSLLGTTGRMAEVIESQRRAIAIRPDHAASASNLLLSLHYLDNPDPAALFQAHLDWGARYGNRFAATNAIHPNDRNPDRKLRIGYISPNFQQHSVAYFLESVLAAHDRSAVEVFCYADPIRPDAVSKRFQVLADHWREITGQSDAAVAGQIRSDAIDILVDLAGHTADNRMIVFAMKPAPLQFTWLGYPDTTGLSTMDYRITDSVADPIGQADSLHREKLLRFQGGAWAYSPPPDAPPVAPPPVVANGFITFGSFNNLPKVTPRVLETWSRILTRVPNSRLFIKSLGLSAVSARDYCLGHLTSHGIDPARIELLGWLPSTGSHLELYNRLDIALDTFPYNGTTTTCEALWMGVPVITFPGQIHTARVGTSLLTHAGLQEMIATDVEGYIRLAVDLAEDRARLSSSRSAMRPKLAASPICDGRRIARQLEEAYRTAWRGRAV
jgi:protein O-GlcNAc transferase